MFLLLRRPNDNRTKFKKPGITNNKKKSNMRRQKMEIDKERQIAADIIDEFEAHL